MRTNYLSVLLVVLAILLAPATSVVAQMQAIGPVGMQNLKVAGTGGTAASVLTFSGLGLTRPIECQGVAEGVATNSLTDNEASWMDNQFNGANGAHYVEILSGPAPGTTYDIAGTIGGSKQITLVQSITGSIGPPPYSYRIRKHRTIANIFGENNESGLTSGDEAAVADQILLHIAGVYQTFYYQVAPPAAGGTGWRNANDVFTSAANTLIYPEDGLIVKRLQPSPMNVVLIGTVKAGTTSLPIFPGDNLVGNPYAASMTLASSGLLSSGFSGGNVSTADQVLVWNGTGYNTYYYQTSGIGGTGWRKGGDAVSDASSAAIPAGISVIIKRKQSFGFNWRIPQHPTTL